MSKRSQIARVPMSGTRESKESRFQLRARLVCRCVRLSRLDLLQTETSSHADAVCLLRLHFLENHKLLSARLQIHYVLLNSKHTHNKQQRRERRSDTNAITSGLLGFRWPVVPFSVAAACSSADLRSRFLVRDLQVLEFQLELLVEMDVLG